MEELPTDQPAASPDSPAWPPVAEPPTSPAMPPVGPSSSPADNPAPVRGDGLPSEPVSGVSAVPPPPSSQATAASSTDVGSSLNGPMPDELRHWSWAAFLMNWIWGIGHNVWIALLMFVPLVNLIFWFYLGAKGNELAWQHRKFQSVEQFKQIQRVWMWWGVGLTAASLILTVVSWSLMTAAFLGGLEGGYYPNETPSDTQPNTEPDFQYQ